MTHISVVVDDEKFAAMANALGTKDAQETIDKAVDLLLTKHRGDSAGQDFIASMRAGHYANVLDERVTTRSWW